mmetsp:Transcript_864/g.1679  ORF Transcript_864/g.1679 Transcript_864/m.1679 type:complete len:207 (-) Transcript_864:188-808(-)
MPAAGKCSRPNLSARWDRRGSSLLWRALTGAVSARPGLGSVSGKRGFNFAVGTVRSAGSPCSRFMTTAVMSSESWPCVSACHRCRAMLAISLAAALGSECFAAMSTASCEFRRSQTPSLPRIRTLSLEHSMRSETSGSAITKGCIERSPSDRVTHRPQRPDLSQTRSGPTRTSTGGPKPCRIGIALWWTAPPCCTMRCRSSSRMGR